MSETAVLPEESLRLRSQRWAEHVRAGGTTPWGDLDPSPSGPAAPAPGPPPSAAHLELSRRVEAPALVAPLLATPPVGRGRVDVPLPGTGSAAGPEAVPPEDLPPADLLRVAVGYLAARLVPDGPPAAAAVRPRRGQRRYVVRGCSLSAAVVRASLAAAGLVEGGSTWRRPTVVLVVGDPLDAMLQAAWTARVRAGGGLRWRRAASASGPLPPGVDLAAVAVDALARAGARDRVELLLLPPGEAVATAAQLLETRAQPVDLPAAYDPARVDLLRRVHQALASREPRWRRALAAAGLDARLGADVLLGRLAVPTDQEERLDAAARALVARLDALGDPGLGVHGDPSLVVPSGGAQGHDRSVPAAATLDRAVEAIRYDAPLEASS